MPGCSIKSCHNWNGNTKGKNIKYFRFPKNENLIQKWKEACGNVNLKTSCICSTHFSEECFHDTKHLFLRGKPVVLKLKSDAVPTKNLTTHHEDHEYARPFRKWKIPPLTDDTDSRTSKITKEEEHASSSSTNSCRKLVVLQGRNNIKEFVTTNSGLNSVHPFKKLKLCNNDAGSICENGRNDLADKSTINTRSFSNSGKMHSSLQLVNITGLYVKPMINTAMVAGERIEAQTSSNALRNENTEAELKRLRAENLELNKKLNTQSRFLHTNVEKKIYEILSPVFTAGQIEMLIRPNQKIVKWSKEDIASAIALHSVSPKAYQYLRNKKYPLPALNTLRKGSINS